MNHQSTLVSYRWLLGSLCLWVLGAWIARQPTPVKKTPPKASTVQAGTAKTKPSAAHRPGTQPGKPQPSSARVDHPADGSVPAQTSGATVAVAQSVATAHAPSAGTVETDPESGLALDNNLMLVKGQCTACHSSKLILQSHFDREKWVERIRWMQRTQKLWDLGESEPAILAYLTRYYGPVATPFDGRRLPLSAINWYKR